MTIQELGYTKNLEEHRRDHNLESFDIGRVILEHKDRYVIKTSEKEFDAELIGNLRFTAENRLDFPAVGDWVAFSEYDNDKAIIHAVYPRNSVIVRRAAGKTSQIQIIASNVDYGLIVQAVDRDFNLNRLERYMTICNASSVDPLIVLSKIDLVSDSDLESIMATVNNRITGVPVVSVSNKTEGYKQLEKVIQKGKTYCLLGSSGVGKSTILNNLSGEVHMKTGEISSSVNKGKHVTSHRELIVLKNGGILIDNPGMREVGIADSSKGLETTFDEIIGLSQNCQFKNCRHINEVGCAVLEAIESGHLDEDAYSNFQKIEKEKMHFESDALERKKKDKGLGKIIKQFKKQRRDNKY